MTDIPRPIVWERKVSTFEWNIYSDNLAPHYGGRLTVRFDFYDRKEADALKAFVDKLIDESERK